MKLRCTYLSGACGSHRAEEGGDCESRGQGRAPGTAGRVAPGARLGGTVEMRRQPAGR